MNAAINGEAASKSPPHEAWDLEFCANHAMEQLRCAEQALSEYRMYARVANRISPGQFGYVKLTTIPGGWTHA